ncbi:MAG: hypothetical protein ABSD38_32830, partial [Syntrophorhabdales bacterium]
MNQSMMSASPFRIISMLIVLTLLVVANVSAQEFTLPGRPGGYPPGPPQIRTCPIKAYGSS